MKRWFARKPTLQGPEPFPPLAPETPFYAIGDVHGRDDLLAQLLDQLDPMHPVVFVGDYVDRGEDSAGVLRRLESLTSDPDARVYCLLGNHEEMLLSFLDYPEQRGRSWLRNGGLQTLASFGVSGISEASPEAARVAASRSLRAAMGDTLIDWLRQRPLYWRSGNVAVVHAGADPAEPIEDQPAKTLMWGHPAFHTTSRQDGIWIVHGHTIVEAPLAREGVISVDTGAFATSHLTVAGISSGSVEFYST